MSWIPSRRRQRPLSPGVQLIGAAGGYTCLRTSFGSSIDERLAMQSGDPPEVHGMLMTMPPQHIEIDYRTRRPAEPEPVPEVPPLPDLD
jgi:hypothetical protein